MVDFSKGRIDLGSVPSTPGLGKIFLEGRFDLSDVPIDLTWAMYPPRIGKFVLEGRFFRR